MSSKPDPYNSLKNKLIFGKYKTSKIIGKGSFGYVYSGENIIDKTISDFFCSICDEIISCYHRNFSTIC